MSTTVVQAAEQVLVGSATTVATAIGTTATGEIGTVENSVAKEAIAATGEAPSSLVDQLHDGVHVIATEVVKGAESAVASAKAHPEILAEGAVAVVLGAATLVQPELAAGEVALIGKMAADHAKQGAEKIAADTGSNVVKAISKDLANHAAEQTAKEAKAKTNTTDTKSNAVPDPKTASPKAVATLVPVAEDKTVVLDPKAPVVKESTHIDTTSANTHQDKTVSVEIASEPSKVASTGSRRGTEPETAPPVSLKITIGSDGEIKAISKGMNENDKSKPVPVEAVEVKKNEIVDAQKSTGTESKESISDVKSKEDLLKPETPATVVVPASVPAALPIAPAESKSITKVNIPPISNLKAGPSELNTSLSQDISTTQNPVTTTTVATVANVTKTLRTTATTTTEPVSDSPTVTISQSSLDELHIKIDKMHESILEITKLLVLHLPNSQISDFPPLNSSSIPSSGPATPLDAAGSTPAPESASKPTPETTPDAQKQHRPINHKRPSVLGNIGKILWPFGGSPSPTSDAETGLETPNLVKVPVVTSHEISGDGDDVSNRGAVRDILV